jgi:hypothetical protein
MIFKESVIAVRPNVESLLSDYFLFSVESDGVECLSENVTNNGHFYCAGTKVVCGF